MDESDTTLVEEIVGILQEKRRPDWIDIHNFRVQRYGQELHIDCHLTMPSYYLLQQVHEEVSQIDHIVNAHQGSETELFIHVDPCVPQCYHYCQVQNCPIRAHPFEKVIHWNIDNVSRNQKHYDRS